MPTWDGKERRKNGYHDILIRIDANLENAIVAFTKHEASDTKNFEAIYNRIAAVERVCYGIGGVVVFMEVITKFIK